jgi:hypothetical protein
VTPEGNATPLYALRLDYGWCETITGGEYAHVAEAIAISIGALLGIRVSTAAIDESRAA